MKNQTAIFTDGSSRGNPGPGGFGAVIVYDDGESKDQGEKFQVKEVGGYEEHTTNNRMEMQAVISALSFASSLHATRYTLTVYCDSSYVINGITKWVFGWQKNGWVTTMKKEVENRDLWEPLAELTRKLAEHTQNKIEWKQVGGHVGVLGNERCDVIATEFADGQKPLLYSGSLSGYSIKNVLDISENSLARSEKNKSSSHSKAKAYSYVSSVDGKIEIHKTWAECEARVKGKKAKYKKSLNPADEASIIESMK